MGVRRGVIAACLFLLVPVGAARAEVRVTIDNDATGVCVDRAEQRAQTVVKTDDEKPCAEFLEILRNETHPEFLSAADDEDGDEENNQVMFEGKEIGSPAPEVHG